MKRAFKPDLFAIIILLAAMNIPLLTGRTPIAWDTFNMPFEEFSITYNAVFFHGALPLWLPFSSYGIPDYFWLAALSIVNFLFIGAGALLRIQNVLLLFKASLFAEQLIAVFGMYLLASQIFRKRTTVFLTCLAFMATFSLYRQAQFNFRITYLLPLILFWMVLFFKRKSPVFLWLAGITTVFSVPGSAFYPLIVEFYGIAIFSLVLFLFDFKAARAIFQFSWQSVVAFASLLVITLVFLYYFRSFNQGVEILRSGRGSNLYVPISDFLTNWKPWNPLVLAGSFLYGVISFDATNRYEYIFYIGLLPLAGVIGAVLYQKRSHWYAVLAAMLFLYAFSLRGYITFAAYFLPYIDITRYAAIIGVIPFRVFLILAAGFGLDLDLTSAQWKKIGFTLLGIAVAVDIFGTITTSDKAISQTGYLEVISNGGNYTFDFKIFLVRLAGYLSLMALAALIHRWNKNFTIGRLALPNLITLGLIFLTIIDLGLFRYNYETKLEQFLQISSGQVQSLPSLQPFAYQDERLKEPQDGRLSKAIGSTSIFQPSNAYVTESYVQFDRCIPAAVLSHGEFEVFSSSLRPMIDNDMVLTSLENAPINLKQIYGCDFPKLRVVSNVVVSPTNQEALSIIKNTDDFSNLLVLSQEFSQEKTSINHLPPKADVQVVSFSPTQMKVNINLDGDKAWLVYSDTYHTDWRVTVNGENRKVERAYLAFKAVPLSRGMNSVIFDYSSIAKQIGYTTLAMLCGVAAFISLCGLLVFLFFDFDR